MVLIVLASASGSPGVSTTALGLTLNWHRPVLLVDADPTGSSAVFAGYFHGTQEPTGGLINLALSLREGTLADALPRETLLLDLRMNGQPQPYTVRAVRLPEGLGLPQTLWQALKLRPPPLPPRMIDNELHFLLGDGPNELLRWRIDELSQTLVLDAAPQAFTEQQVEVNRAAAQVTLPAHYGAFLNYDLQWQRRLGGASTLDGLVELGGLTPYGDLQHQQLFRNGGEWIRLNTRWTWDQPARLASWRLGDTVAQPGSWGRAMRLGGLQWTTDFSLRPGFLSFPLPTLRGEAALPSTVDVFVNNSQRLQGRVQPGPFDISELPLVTGQGEIRTVVRDLLGREQVILQPYYISPALLRAGLDAWSVELGRLRQDYGQRSDRYGRAVGMLTWRRGLSDRFTGEVRTEAARRQQALGVSGLWLLGRWGTLNLSTVASRSDDPAARRGWLATAGLERQGLDWSANLELRRASTGFTQLGQPVSPRWSVSASTGTQWQGWGLGLGWVHQGALPRAAVDAPPTGVAGLAPATRLLSFNAGRGVGRWGYVGVSALRAGGTGGGTALSVFWSLPIGDHQNLSASWQGQRSRGQPSQHQWQLQFQDNPPPGEGLGYQLLTESGGRTQAQAQWLGRYAALDGGVSKLDGRTDVRAGASGGLAWMDGTGHAGRRIDGGFALVQVGEAPNVRVTHDHQVVARTDARGRAFLPGLRGYQVNRVGVIADDLPLDAEIDALEIQVTPAARSASLIRFPVAVSRTATFRLVDETGQPLPAGLSLRLAGQARTFPLGLDGKGYVTGLTAGGPQRLEVAGGDVRCGVMLQLPAGDAEMPDLGTLVCRSVDRSNP